MTCQLCSVCFWFSQDWGRLLMQKQCSDLLYLAKKTAQLSSGEDRTGFERVSWERPVTWCARPVAEKVETADVGSPRPSTSTQATLGKGAHQLGATHMWDCHAKGRVKNCQTWVTFCQIWATHCQTWAKSCQTWATYCQSWATYCQTWGTSWLAYTTDPCYLGFQLCFMINTSEKYERTQRGERAI